jgi:S-adenosylmethionine hydrolase
VQAVFLVTDYGMADEFVGLMKASIVWAARVPDVVMIDLSHSIRRHDVRQAALMLRRCLPFVAGAIVVAVVDPGVGGQREAIVLQKDSDHGRTTFIGPDNGIFSLMEGAPTGGGAKAYRLDRRRVRELAGLPAELPGGPTFDGRDLFGPAAGLLARGVPLEHLGEAMDPRKLRSLDPLAPPARLPEGVLAEVTWVDVYGNVELNLRPEEMARMGVVPTGLRYHEAVVPLAVARSFEGIPRDSFGLIEDSYGYLSVAKYGSSAADELGVREGDFVLIVTGEGP